MCLLSHISPLERLFVLKILSRTQQATEVEKFVEISLKPLRCRDTPLPVVEYCSNIPRTFSTAELSKGPKKTNNRLNSTWNTTRCKVASFFSVSVFCLKSSVYLPVCRISSACSFKGLRTRVSHFSAFSLLLPVVCKCNRIHVHVYHSIQGQNSKNGNVIIAG